MKNLLLAGILLLLPIALYAQADLNYYLPKNTTYNSAVPTPASVIGHEVGEWHVSHDKLVSYMRSLAKSSDRVQLMEYGRTFENRPLLLLTITSPENLGKIDQIRTQHKQLTDPTQSGKLATEKMPAVIWLGYSVHGNESSGANASLLVAYHLAAAQGKEAEALLENTIVLLDPSINPDGLNRFASWVNMHKSSVQVSDPYSRELNEPFPRGRTNHYWFDLNRDWLPTQLPESQGRIAQFQRWKPNILTDHHEMGTNSTFFFQPGIPSRKNPLTPDRNVELTGKIAKYHARALDKIGSLYYSEESFDDFYYGKGSTYPDVQGSIGILFEQASSRGHAQESQHGVLTFPFTIRNQFTTSLSTLQAGYEMRKELLDYQRSFYQNAMEEARKLDTQAYVFGDSYDPHRLKEFVEMLQRHEIAVHTLKKDYKDFRYSQAYVVPLNQPQNRLIRAMFRTQTQFNDSLFYDVSTWTLPLAFDLEHEELGAKALSSLLGEKLDQFPTLPSGLEKGSEAGTAGFAFRWDAYFAPKLAYTLLKEGVQLKVASQPFSARTQGKTVEFDYGTILIPATQKDLVTQQLSQLLDSAARSVEMQIYPLETGLTSQGIDFGSSSFVTLKQPQVAVLAGGGISSYDVGEIWHLLDQRHRMPVSVLDVAQFNYAKLSRYTTIVLPDGSYSGISATAIAQLKAWVQTGGTLVGIQGGAKWAQSIGLARITYRSPQKQDSLSYRPYAKVAQDLGSKRLGGAIFEAEIDLTHPLAYGFHRNTLPVFRNDARFAEKSKNPYATPLRYTDQPLLSGYVHPEHLEAARNSASILVNSFGRGRTISFLENPNFRAFWYGTNRLFMNALFFGSTLNRRAGG